MRGVHVGKVDLNLVPALAALLEERQVSRAAQRMQLSQPAMSRLLGRLRRQFDDELLVRGPKGYQLSPRAERLRKQLLDVLPSLEQLFATERFDPSTATNDFRLVGTDYAVLTFGPSLFRFLHEHAPQSTLCFENWGESTFDRLDDGAFDLIFYGAEGPPHLTQELLLTDVFVCVMCASHPLAGETSISLTDYLAWPHVAISIDDGQQPAVDEPLRALGRPRRTELTLPFHFAGLLAVTGTEMIVTVPSRLLSTAAPAGVAVVPAPSEVAQLNYSMIWSPRLSSDPAHAWLRQAVRISCQG